MIRDFDTLEKAVSTINSIVCENFSVDESKIYDKFCHREISKARSFAIYILHKEYGYSASELAKAYKRNRRSIYGNCEKIGIFIDLYEDYNKDYISIKEKLLHL